MVSVMADITLLLEQAGMGDRSAESELLTAIHHELHRLASMYMRKERPGHLLQTTALVNEAYLRLLGGRPISFSGRAEFFSAAARVMRQTLVDYARAAQTGKRQASFVDLNPEIWPTLCPVPMEDVVALDHSLDALRAISARCAEVVELRFFAGLDVPETAAVLSVSEKTVKREWQFARVYLESRLRPEHSAR